MRSTVPTLPSPTTISPARFARNKARATVPTTIHKRSAWPCHISLISSSPTSRSSPRAFALDNQLRILLFLTGVQFPLIGDRGDSMEVTQVFNLMYTSDENNTELLGSLSPKSN